MNLSILADNAVAASTPSGSRSTLAAAPPMRLDNKVLYLNGVRGTTGPAQRVTITNRGTSSFKLVDASFIFSGANADQFTISGRTNRTVQAGAKATYYVSLRAGSNASLTDVLTATLSIKASRAPSASAAVTLRAIATAGEGGDLEPSLARIMALYNYTINVGDTDPSTTNLDLDGSPTDQTYSPRFQKVGGDPITITPLANFVSDASEPGRIGYYAVGHANNLTEVFHYDTADSAQTTSPDANGSTTFDPGSTPFGLYAQIPVFRNADGTARTIYSEDALNTWEPNASNRNKVRVYPLKIDNQVVANSYVVTFEDYTVNDQNDYVYVINNVTRLASMAEGELIPQGGQPVADRMVFSNIGQKNQTYPNYVTTSATVQLVNTGNQPLVIDSLSLSSGASSYFQIVNPPTSPVTIARNGTYDITVNFIANTTNLKTGTLTINSNDHFVGQRQISLAGYWQMYSEHADNNQISVEPSLQELFDLFGYTTVATKSGESTNTHGAATPIGDEVLSGYWNEADTSLPVSIQQIAAYHQQQYSTEVAWYAQGHPYYKTDDARYTGTDPQATRNTIYNTYYLDGQTVLPRLSNRTLPAVGTFETTGTFGFRIDAELSDDSLNIPGSGNSGGHHLRFFPLRDANGAYVPNTYLMVMDAGAINFDFNDNLYIIRNIRPAAATAQITGLTGYSSGGKASLDWASVAGATGYRVQRSDGGDGPWTTIADDYASSSYVDGAKVGRNWYYRVFAIASNGTLSTPTETRVHIYSA